MFSVLSPTYQNNCLGNNEESLMLDFRDHSHAEYGNSVTMIVIWSLFFYPRGKKEDFVAKGDFMRLKA